MSRTTHRRRSTLATGAALAGVLFLLAACSTDTDDTDNAAAAPAATRPEATSNNDAPGKKVIIGFSGPAADHGWLAAINSSAQAEAEEVLRRRRSRSPRAPTTPTSRSARSRPSSTTRSTRSCCCRPTARRSPRSRPRRCRPASRSSTSTASSPRRSPPAPPSSATTTAWASRAGTYACKLIKDKKLTDPVDRRDRRHRLAAADPGPLEGLRRRAEGVRPDRRQPGRGRVHRRVR